MMGRKNLNNGRPADTQRILRLLAETNGMSNRALRTELNLTDKRFAKIREELLDEGAIEKYQCQGGGVRITNAGEQSLPKSDQGPKSKVAAEKALYAPLVNYLNAQAAEDGAFAVALDTSNLRNKGKWQNPDVTQIAYERYKYLCKSEIVVSTFEVKQWGGWDIRVVFEAASHRRFSHEATVVLEWLNGIDFSLSDPTYKLDEIARECRRFGVGLQTLRPYYGSYRLHTHIQPTRHVPVESAVEGWLEYIFERKTEAKAAYEEIVRNGTGS